MDLETRVEDSYQPTDGMVEEAQRGLDWRSEYNRGGTAIGIARARDIVNRKNLPIDTWRRIKAFFDRHEIDKQGEGFTPDEDGYPSNGRIAWALWGGDAGYSRAEAIVEAANNALEENKEVPALVVSEAAPESEHLSERATCPVATQDVAVNLANRQTAIDEANYGPLDPALPNEEYWQAKADQFDDSVEAAKAARCGNCAAFIKTPEMLDCISEGLDNPDDAYAVIAAGDLGYCEVFDFKCASSRTCDAWIAGGPVEEQTYEEEVVEEPVARNAAWIADDTEERRVGYLTNAELRADGDGSTLVGYAAMFDSPSEDLGGFTERIAPGAFKRTLGMDADVRLLFDHEGLPLARSKSGTLSLEEDDLGLKVEAALDPNSPVARSVISAVQRGDIDQMSFAFRTVSDSWSADRSLRTLEEVQLFDVSVVTYPAYEATMAAIRSRQPSEEEVVVPPKVFSKRLAAETDYLELSRKRS